MDSVGRITTAGVVSKFCCVNRPGAITAGPDNALWFRETNAIDRISTSGVLSSYTASNIASLTAGPDGALWFTDEFDSTIGRSTTTGIQSTFADPGNIIPGGLTAGPDGDLWFTNPYDYSIGRITTAGVVTRFTAPTIDFPVDITAGLDGALWFADDNAGHTGIGRITAADSVNTLPMQGPAGGALTLTGAGFASGETVAVRFDTGLSSPTSIPLCTATAASNGTFSCRASVPASAGSFGTHTIEARGMASTTVARAVFLLIA
jgi:virginiamycin B lyase